MYLWTKRERKTHPLSQDGEKHDYLHTETFYRLLTVIIYQCLVVTDYGCGVCECLVAQECLILCHPMDSEKAMATQSGTLAWKIPWMEEHGTLQYMWSRRVGHDWETSLSLSCIGEGNGNPLQCSCLENPRDGGAWWAAIYGVAQSQTRLKWFSSSSGTPWTVARQVPLSMIIQSRILSGLPCSPPGDLPNPGMELRSPALQAGSLQSEPPGKPLWLWIRHENMWKIWGWVWGRGDSIKWGNLYNPK